jgi:hypothetical protein
MTITINGTTGITNDGGYTGDGVVFANTTPANTLVTTTGGNVGIGTSSPSAVARASFGNSAATTPALWGAFFGTNTGGASAAPNFGLTIGWNRSNGGGESNIVYGTGAGSSTGLAFSSSDGTTVTERARINSSGNLLVGTTTAFGTSGLTFSPPDVSGCWSACTSASGAIHWRFYNPNGVVGAITTNGSSTTYSTSSDYRLKHDIQPMTGALARVAALKPCTYKWKVDGSDGEGFIAHELAEVVPQCVTGEKDAVDADGNPVYQGIDTSFLVATLTAAIQEQQAIIQQLQADVAALKGA